jgi:hypothetical protein
MAQVVSRWPLTAGSWFALRSVHVGFVVDRVSLGQIFPPVLQFPPLTSVQDVDINEDHGKDGITELRTVFKLNKSFPNMYSSRLPPINVS